MHPPEARWRQVKCFRTVVYTIVVTCADAYGRGHKQSNRTRNIVLLSVMVRLCMGSYPTVVSLCLKIVVHYQATFPSKT